MDYKDWLNNKDLEYKEEVLHFAGVNTIELAKKYGTPIYVLNEQLIRKRYRNLKNVLNKEYEKNEIRFAMKSNSNLSVLKIIDELGAGFDCTSAGEIYTCLKAGISPQKIIYTGNMFTNEDFRYALENNILINLDSISQLYRLVKMYDELGKEKGIISFRFNPEFGAGHHAHTITAGKEIKFGVLDNQVIEAYSKAKELGFEKFGIHMHIGSGIIDPYDYERPIERYLSIVEKIAESVNIEFEYIDFGGGLGIPYRPEEEPVDLEVYRKIVVRPFTEAIKKGKIGKPIFIFEPGRYISSEASIILAQINTIKNNGYKRFAGLDAGFNTLVRPTMYGSYHHIVSCKENPKNKILKYDVAGPICESGDILGKERDLAKLEEGDYLAIIDAGAYGFTMSSPYNSRPRPAEVLIYKGESHLIRKAETFDDLLAHQIIPDHLK